MRLPIVLGTSPTLKIRGIIASEDIKKGRIIERCPVVLTDIHHDEHMDKTALRNYYFFWNKKNSALVFGYGSLYNHSYNPNTEYVYNYKKKLMVYRAIKNIKKGEELTVNYNGVPKSRSRIDIGLVTPDKRYK